MYVGHPQKTQRRARSSKEAGKRKKCTQTRTWAAEGAAQIAIVVGDALHPGHAASVVAAHNGT